VKARGAADTNEGVAEGEGEGEEEMKDPKSKD